MQLLVANNAVSALALGISSTDTACVLQAGTGALFPNPTPGQYFALTFASTPPGLTREIVYVTARSGDTITSMLRGQEGTTAQAFLAGDFAWNRFTAGAALAFPQMPSFSGPDPNGFVPGVAASQFGAASMVVTSNNTVWFCSVGGNEAGAVWLPLTGNFRFRVTTSIFFIYVSTTGSDSNDGLTPSTAFLTRQRAWEYMTQGIDLNGNTIICQVEDGTYTDSLRATGTVLGQGDATTVRFRGNIANPQNCVLIGDGVNDIMLAIGASFYIEGFTLQNPASTSGNCISSEFDSVLYFNNLIFGEIIGSHLFADTNGTIVAGRPSSGSDLGGGATYTIQGNALNHRLAFYNGLISVFRSSVAIYFGPTFASAFVHAGLNSTIQDFGNTYIGSAIGLQWIATINSVVFTNGEPSNYLPGSLAGVPSFGGQYF